MPPSSTRVRVIGLAVVLGCVGAEDEQVEPETPALVPAVDLDPDPEVVEVELIAEAGVVEYRAGVATPVLGYRDGGRPGAPVRVPGPMIVAKRGDRLIVHFHNGLDRPTTVHWHGLRLPADMDGNPMVSGAVEPGGDFRYDFVLEDAGTFWYHPHVEVDTQVESGLHGQLLVREPAPPPVSADRVFELDDVELDAVGELVLEPSELDVWLGRVGNVLLVNGAPPSSLTVAAGGRERWRFVNAANGRHFRLRLRELVGEERQRPLTVVAWDGGRVEQAYSVDDLLIAPGERYELLVDLDGEPGERWLLETLAVDRGEGREDGGPYDLVELRLAAAPELDGAALAGPEDFAAMQPELSAGPETPSRPVVLEHLDDGLGPTFLINGQRWPLNTPVEVELGATEIWEVENLSPGWHPLHIHGLFFEVLDVEGVPPPVRGRKDTVAIPGESTARLLLRYEAPGMWMFHCTIPEHAERGMMGDLSVLSP